MKVMIEIEDYKGNTIGFVKFKSDKPVNIREIELEGFSLADEEHNSERLSLQHIRIQKEDE